MPIEDIARDARTVMVPVYAYPFVHERVLCDLRARRPPGLGGVDRNGTPWFWRDFESVQVGDMLHVRRTHDVLLPAPLEEDELSSAGAECAQDERGGQTGAHTLAHTLVHTLAHTLAHTVAVHCCCWHRPVCAALGTCAAANCRLQR